MTEKTESPKSSRSCKVCGTPAGDGTLCGCCGAVLEVPTHRGAQADPGSASEQPTPLRAARHLRQMRAFYGAGAALWVVSTAWTAWDSPGSRPMWTSVLLFVVFTGLLALATVWLRRLEDTNGAGSARHAAPRASVVARVGTSHS